jgi:hypothetical protein
MMCWGLWLEKTMKNASIPYAAILISGLTLAYSMYVAFALTGNVFGNVKIVQLEPYGGVTASHLKNLTIHSSRCRFAARLNSGVRCQIWRCVCSQKIDSRKTVFGNS